MSKYILGASSDIGYEREQQEDFVRFKELDEDNMLVIVADGTGSINEHIQPAVMSTLSVLEELSDIFEEDKELFMNNCEFFIKRAMINANGKIGTLKIANEEIYSGYACSMTVALFDENRRIYIGNAGNTRFYIMRNGSLIQITTDQTKAQELLDKGLIDIDTYHVHPDRLQVTSGIGVTLNPEIQTLNLPFKTNDIALMTSDGIHYAIRLESMSQIILESQDCLQASQNLVEAAKDVIKYPDNVTAVLIQ